VSAESFAATCVEFALAQRVQEIALQDDALALPPR
jgi:hypothetical protein